MTNILFALSLIAAFGGGAAVPPQGFACEMNALTPKERADLPKIFERLLQASPSARELPNGYELSFAKSDGLFPLAAEWVSAESKCCPFFDLALKVERYGGPMTVRITGPKGVKAFIADDLPHLHHLLTK
jgi:hypothetical protein